MVTTVECEQRADYAGTAEAMTRAFGSREPISPARLEWLYERAFGLGTTVVAVLLTLVVGFAGTWRALGVMPAPLLRNE